jgi:hypothetical protein
MARETQRYKILFRVIPEMTPPNNVMHLKIFHASTMLAPPAVALQDLTPELTIRFGL